MIFMIIMLGALIFLFGLAIGSFLNVVIYRTLHGESVFEGRSKCPKCNRKIQAIDNIPLVSFLLLRGRCRACKASISWSYPVVEFLTGTLFLWWFVAGSLFFRLTQSPFVLIQPLFWLVVGILLLSIFFSDLLYGMIPNILVFLLIGMAFVYRFVLFRSGIMQAQDFLTTLYGAAGASLFFLLLILVTRGRGMGMGDVKLVFAMGIILGLTRTLVAVFFSFVSGAVVAILLLMIGKKKFGQTIPFGPFLVLGTFMALLWGQNKHLAFFF
jgi:prepilin signal peptidase PulO-like enzyme (type II secretory pathway)